MKVQLVSVKEINPAEYNPRAISREALDGLKASIREFGLVDPLIVNKRNKNLVGGHQRYRAAIEEGLKEVPVVYVDLSDEKERALNIALNSQKISGFFTDDLTAMLDELKTDLGEELFKDLRFDDLLGEDSWTSDLEKLESLEEINDKAPGVIKITCREEDYDAVLIYIKDKLLETSFTGVHVE